MDIVDLVRVAATAATVLVVWLAAQMCAYLAAAEIHVSEATVSEAGR